MGEQTTRYEVVSCWADGSRKVEETYATRAAAMRDLDAHTRVLLTYSPDWSGLFVREVRS